MPAMLPELPPPMIESWPLPYEERLDQRAHSTIEGLVIHCTETPDLAHARRIGEREIHPSGTGNSGHFYIDIDGRIYRFVTPERIAHHVRGHNARTIGIELVNRGRFPHWLRSDWQAMDAPYTDAQIDALIALIQLLQAELPSLRWITGHEDLDTEQVPADDDPQQLVARKRDPGPQFPWQRVVESVSLQRR
jgi:N-acetylmuramoyl-L-alanine amidase